MTLSNHFKLSLVVIATIAITLLSVGACLERRLSGRTPVLGPAHIVLPLQDKEVINYNENRHTISVTTSSGTVTQYSRNPSIEIRKNGTVKVDAHAWGVEVRPFLGMGYSDTGRMYTGCDLFYFHQFDISASFGWTADNNKSAFQPMLAIGWNFWSHTSLNIGINPLTVVGYSKPQPALFLSVRL